MDMKRSEEIINECWERIIDKLNSLMDYSDKLHAKKEADLAVPRYLKVRLPEIDAVLQEKR